MHQCSPLRNSFIFACSTITLGGFSLREGIDFVRRRTGNVYQDTDSQELVLELGGFPLALDQAAAYLKLSNSKLLGYLEILKKVMINQGTPTIQDEDLAIALSAADTIECLLLNLTKLSLFKEASEDTIRVHRLVQDIIMEDVMKNKDCLKTTLENIQKMLSHSIENEELPFYIKLS